MPMSVRPFSTGRKASILGEGSVVETLSSPLNEGEAPCENRRKMFEVKKNNTDRHISHGTDTTHLRQADLGITLIHETFEQAQSEF